MVSKRRQIQRKIAKERSKTRHAADIEKDTIYWLVFVPRPDVAITANEQADIWKDPWRIRLSGNPKKCPEYIVEAIRVFEVKFDVKSWQEIAVRHYVDGLNYS